MSTARKLMASDGLARGALHVAAVDPPAAVALPLEAIRREPDGAVAVAEVNALHDVVAEPLRNEERRAGGAVDDRIAGTNHRDEPLRRLEHRLDRRRRVRERARRIVMGEGVELRGDDTVHRTRVGMTAKAAATAIHTAISERTIEALSTESRGAHHARSGGRLRNAAKRTVKAPFRGHRRRPKTG